MRRIRTFTMLFAVLFVCLSAVTEQSGGGTAKEFGAKLKEYSGKIETITCDFTQVRHMSLLTNEVKTNGRFYYKREGNMCLEFKHPAGDLIVMSDKKFKIVAEGTRNVVSMNSHPMLKQLNNMLTACWTGDIKLLESGARVEYGDTGTNYTVGIYPTNRKAKNQVSVILLTFDKQDMSLNSMRMTEASGDYTEYTFSAKQFNVPVDNSKFAI